MHKVKNNCIYLTREWIVGNAGCPLCKEPITSETKHSKRNHNRNVNFDQNLIENPPIDNMREGINDEHRVINRDSTHRDDKPYIHKTNHELNKYKAYKQLLKIHNWLEKGENTSHDNMELVNKPVDTGAISYSLPSAAIYSRSLENEIRRLEIELYNQKVIEIYDNPLKAMTKYEEELENIMKNNKGDFSN